MLQRHGHLLLTLLIALGVLVGCFGEMLIAPNQYMFSASGDGLKNYFTFSYHLAHDKTATNFDGMNYPYGEHIMYTDGHPLLAALLKPFGGPDSWVADHAVGIMNMSMLFGWLLTILFTYLLLVRLGIRKILAVLFAVAVGILTPQLFRMEGHFALSYSFAFPLSWWLLLRTESGSWKAFLLLALNHLVWMGTHAYLGVIVAAFTLLMVLVSGVKKPRKWKPVVKNLAAIALPVLAFMLFVELTDHHPNRTDNPSGLFLHNAEADDLLVPHHGPIRAYLDTVVPGGVRLKWEAWAYVGVPGVLLVLFLVVSGVMASFRSSVREKLAAWIRPSMRHALIASGVLLLFAMGIPYRQFPELAEWFPVIKQFRATGRFDWPFWWVVMVLLAAWSNQLFIRARQAGMAIAVLIPLVLMWEGSYHIRAVSRGIHNEVNLLHTAEPAVQDVLQQFDAGDYQCLLPLPFYHGGSESFSRPRLPDVDNYTIQLSQHTGLPAMSAALTRISIDESRSIFQAISPFGPKEDLPLGNKPILILTSGQQLNQAEELLLEEAQTVCQSGSLTLHSLEASSLNQPRIPKDVRQKVIDWTARQQTGEKPDFFIYDSDSLGVALYEGFESHPDTNAFCGYSAFSGMKRGEHVIAVIDANAFQRSTPYVLSLWLRNIQPDALNLHFQLIVEEVGEAGLMHRNVVFPEQTPLIAGDWSLVESEFEVSPGAREIRVLTLGKDNSKAALWADELLIRKEDVQVYKEDVESGRFFWNNWVWPLASSD